MNKKVVKGIKIGLGIIADIGIELLCVNAGRFFTRNEKNPIMKTCAMFGSAAIGGMVVDEANKYISSEVDNVVEFVDGVTDAIRKNREAGANE